MPYKVAVIVGSLRKDSLTRKVANALAELAPSDLSLTQIEIGGLPLYNQDLEVEPQPHPWVSFRGQVRGMDAVIFATPEYNRSVPGALKNAIDVGSRPPGQSVWAGKPAAVISVAPRTLGAFGANHHLRQSLVFLDMPTMQMPEAYIGNAAQLFDDKGRLSADSTREFLTKFMSAFATWIERFVPKQATVKAG
jgi:chromate reductase